ncbi:MAG: hypothetical protein KUG73_07195, partial [Pseudomonadales bacterium]|nr:hypothetical protein [Pseudomonadales bacterium]
NDENAWRMYDRLGYLVSLALKDENLIPNIPNSIALEIMMNLAIGIVYSWTLSGTEPLSNKVTELFGLWKEQNALAKSIGSSKQD